ncbi:IMP dehydrogenase, partial [Streptomyces sp. NPDC003343]
FVGLHIIGIAALLGGFLTQMKAMGRGTARFVVRASIDQLLPDILSGAIEPGKVFDATTGLDGVPAGYQDMADRNSLKVLIKP